MRGITHKLLITWQGKTTYIIAKVLKNPSKPSLLPNCLKNSLKSWGYIH